MMDGRTDARTCATLNALPHSLNDGGIKRCKDRYMYYDNSHLIENNYLIFHINDYKAHLSSFPSQFDKLISIGLNICIKIAVFSQNYTATAAKFDE